MAYVEWLKRPWIEVGLGVEEGGWRGCSFPGWKVVVAWENTAAGWRPKVRGEGMRWTRRLPFSVGLYWMSPALLIRRDLRLRTDGEQHAL
jgi:hypothetical protein